MLCVFCNKDFDKGRVRALPLSHTAAHLGAPVPLIVDAERILTRLEIYDKKNGSYMCWDCVGLLKLTLKQALENFEEDVKPIHLPPKLAPKTIKAIIGDIEKAPGLQIEEEY